MLTTDPFTVFPIKKQGEQDYACGLYCLVSAAIHLGALRDSGDGVARVLRNLDGVSATTSKNLLTSGLGEKGVRRLATAAKLAVWRPNNVSLDDLASRAGKEKHIWMALIRMRFDDPKQVVASYDDRHYVLVLDVDDAAVVVADPQYPLREPRSFAARGLMSMCVRDASRSISSPSFARAPAGW